MNASPASLLLNIANFRSQTLNSLFSSSQDTGGESTFASILSLKGGSDAASVLGVLGGTAGGTASIGAGVATSGRKLSLRDPEAAYSMMSDINGRDITYKAQFSELGQMKEALALMRDAGAQLGSLTTASGADAIKTQLQGFADQYNAWIGRFNPDIEKGGLLADTQAAQISLYELDQSIKNIFFGAKDGLRGLADIGLTVDPHTKGVVIDGAKLDAVLAGNKQGVVNALQEFGENFAKSANLLTTDGNFIRRRLDNLNGAIRYIDANMAAWQGEFGSGDAARPSGRVAQALAAYQQTFG